MPFEDGPVLRQTYSFRLETVAPSADQAWEAQALFLEVLRHLLGPNAVPQPPRTEVALSGSGEDVHFRADATVTATVVMQPYTLPGAPGHVPDIAAVTARDVPAWGEELLARLTYETQLMLTTPPEADSEPPVPPTVIYSVDAIEKVADDARPTSGEVLRRRRLRVVTDDQGNSVLASAQPFELPPPPRPQKPPRQPLGFKEHADGPLTGDGTLGFRKAGTSGVARPAAIVLGGGKQVKPLP